MPTSSESYDDSDLGVLHPLPYAAERVPGDFPPPQGWMQAQAEMEDLRRREKRVDENARAVRVAAESLKLAIAPRFILVLALLGALGVTIPALITGRWEQILASVSFDVLIFWPVAYLYSRS